MFQLRNFVTLSACALATASLLTACGGGSADTPAPATQTITVTAAPASLVAGNTSTITINGKTGTGASTYAVTGGTASSSCSFGTGNNVNVLTVAANAPAGTCVVTASVAADSAHTAATNTATVTFTAAVVLTSTSPIDFETSGRGAGFGWSSFENGANAAAQIVNNLSKTGINTSDKVIKFTALQGGQPWAGFQSAHGTDLGTVTFSASNALVKMMVYKSNISDVGIKFASSTDASTGEIKVANTATNTWELLTFNFCGRAGEVNDQIIFFPDFNFSRSSDNIAYLDNITFNACPVAAVPTTAPAAPTALAANVASLYGDGYTTITGTDTPNWGQSTVVSAPTYASNNVLKLTNFSYQGVTTAAPQNVSTFTKLHIDFWSETATTIEVKLVSLSPTLETSLFIPVSAGTWTSQDIPMANFTAPDKTKFQQLILAAANNGGILYVDNIYFWK